MLYSGPEEPFHLVIFQSCILQTSIIFLHFCKLCTKILISCIHAQPSVDHIYTHTNSLVKEQASVREALRAMNERNRRMEADLTYIRSVLKRQFGTSPSAELELRAFPGDY